MKFLGVVTGLPLWREALRGLGALLCNFIYSIVAFMFQVFITVAQANIFDEKTLGPLYQRVTLIITIVMTFYITFEFIKYIIQPDTMGDKEKGVGNIGLKIVVVIILIAMVPKIFSLGYNLQGRIINQNVIGKIILGKTTNNYNKIGNEFSADMLETFYKIGECRNVSGKCVSTGRKYDINLERIKTTGVVNILPGINDSENVDNTGLIETDSETPAIEFNGFMAIAVGAILVYILILYSIDLGLRYAQLLYLQVIAPIAIMGYLLPKKDGMFQKWTKQCLTTYLDVFIRLSLMYFALLLIDLIKNNKTSLFAGIPGVNDTVETFAYIAIILGLLLFVQKAPKLLQELFPSSGAAGIGMGLKAADRVAPLAAKGIAGSLAAAKGIGTTGARAIRAIQNNRKNGKRLRDMPKDAFERRNQRRKIDAAEREKKDLNELNDAENDLINANRKYEEAKKNGANNEELAKLEGERNKALERYKKSREKVTGRVDEKTGEIVGGSESYKRDLAASKTAAANLKEANKELEAAKQSGDANRIAEATIAQKKAQSEFDASVQKMDAYRRETAESAKTRLQERKDNIDKANSEYRGTQEYKDVERTNQEVEQAKAALESAQIKGDQQLVNDAQAELERATQANQTAKERLEATAEARNLRLASAKNDVERKQTELEIAQENLKQAQQSKDVNTIIAAHEALDKANEEYEAAKAKRYDANAAQNEKNNRVETLKDMDVQIQSSKEQLAEAENKKYVSVAGATVGGIVGTVKNIIPTAMKAEKLSDISQKVKEGVQKEVKEIQAIDKYIEAGGEGGLRGVIKRHEEQARKEYGIPTTYETIAVETRALEPAIKNLEKKTTLTKDVKATADSAEDRLKDKIDELKQIVPENAKISTGLKDAVTGEDILVKTDGTETLGDIHRRYSGEAIRLQAEANEAAKRAEANRAILNQDPGTLSGDELQKYNEATQMEEYAKNKATEAANAQYAADQIKKNAARYQFTSILQDMAKGLSIDEIKAKGIYDGVAVEKVRDAVDSIKLARQNPEIVNEMKNRLPSNLYAAFINGNITNFEQLDKIKTATINAGNAYERSLKEAKAKQTSLQTSNVTAKEKSEDEFNGSGSNK